MQSIGAHARETEGVGCLVKLQAGNHLVCTQAHCKRERANFIRHPPRAQTNTRVPAAPQTRTSRARTNAMHAHGFDTEPSRSLHPR